MSTSGNSYVVWTYDPAFALGPFLQLPPYLPSGQGLKGSCTQWYGSSSSNSPADGASADNFSSQMSAHAPTFIPAAVQARRLVAGGDSLDLPIAAVANPTHVYNAQDGSPVLSVEARPIGPIVSSPHHSPADISKQMLGSPLASTMAYSTSAGSRCDSVPEEESQDIDAMVSARSEVTSADTTVGSSQPCESNESLAAGSSQDCDGNANATSADSLRRVAFESARASDVGESSATELSAQSCAAKAQVEDVCMYSFESALAHDEYSYVIDPEAPDPTPSEIARARKAMAKAESKLAKAESSSKAGSKVSKAHIGPDGKETAAEKIPLDVVVGCWWDAKNSFYEVTFDDGTNSSCHVKTSRPGGQVRETRALIRIGQVRGKSAGRILWGSAFVLETPIDDVDFLTWRSIRGGKDFSWTRHQDNFAREPRQEHDEFEHADVPDDARSLEAASSSTDMASGLCWSPAPGLEANVEEPMNQCSFSTRGKFGSTSRRVWRAVSNRHEAEAVHFKAAQPEEVPKTPSEVASAPYRWVQSKRGGWRVIEKGWRAK